MRSGVPSLQFSIFSFLSSDGLAGRGFSRAAQFALNEGL
jgi:hypothetical protein